MNISLRQIEVFLYTANSGCLSKAAEKLYISSAAASMALKEFETQLGGQLFDRVRGKLILNESGRAMIPMASEIIGRASELTNCFSDKTILFGNLIIGASSTIGNYVLPEHIASFIKKNTMSTVRLDVGNTEKIIEKVLQFEVDAGIIEGLCYESKIEVTPWIDDELVIFCSVQHRLAGIKTISLEDLQSCSWILRERGSGTRRIFENQINAIPLKIHVLLELGHSEAVKNAVSNGNGISCLSKYALVDLVRLDKIKLIETPFLNLKRKFYLLIHRDKYKTMVLKGFLRHLHIAGIGT